MKHYYVDAALWLVPFQFETAPVKLRDGEIIITLEKEQGTYPYVYLLHAIDGQSGPDSPKIFGWSPAIDSGGNYYESGAIKTIVIPLPNGIDLSELIFLVEGNGAIVNLTIIGKPIKEGEYDYN